MVFGRERHAFQPASATLSPRRLQPWSTCYVATKPNRVGCPDAWLGHFQTRRICFSPFKSIFDEFLKIQGKKEILATLAVDGGRREDHAGLDDAQCVRLLSEQSASSDPREPKWKVGRGPCGCSGRR